MARARLAPAWQAASFRIHEFLNLHIQVVGRDIGPQNALPVNQEQARKRANATRRQPKLSLVLVGRREHVQPRKLLLSNRRLGRFERPVVIKADDLEAPNCRLGVLMTSFRLDSRSCAEEILDLALQPYKGGHRSGLNKGEMFCE